MKNSLIKLINKLLGRVTSASTDELDPNNYDYKEYYANGQLKRVKPIVNGKRHGIWKEYHETGKLTREITYDKGKINGIQKWYYETGKLRREALYKMVKNMVFGKNIMKLVN